MGRTISEPWVPKNLKPAHKLSPSWCPRSWSTQHAALVVSLQPVAGSPHSAVNGQPDSAKNLAREGAILSAETTRITARS